VNAAFARLRLVVISAAVCTMLFASARAARDPNAPVVFNYPGSELDDVLHVYSSLAGRPVYVDAGVGGRIDVISQGAIPREDALPWLRKLLLERYGIQIEDTLERIRVSWAADHPAEREATKRTVKSLPAERVIDTSRRTRP
jgi:type II secretory pathway component GspD/PulD (secretin)